MYIRPNRSVKDFLRRRTDRPALFGADPKVRAELLVVELRFRGGLARDERGQFLLCHVVGTGGTLRQYEIPQLGRAVPDPDLDIFGELETKLSQDSARIVTPRRRCRVR